MKPHLINQRAKAALAIFMLLSLSACGTAAPKLVGKTYDQAYDALKKAGIEQDDADYVYQDGSDADLTQLSADGVVIAQSVKPGDEIPGEGITITCKSVSKDLGDALRKGKGKPASDTYQKIVDAKYTPTYLEATSKADITSMVVNDITGKTGQDAVVWIVTKVAKPDPSKKTVCIAVQSEEQYKKAQEGKRIVAALQKKLSVSAAWSYVDQAMSQKCPWGHNLHDVDGVITQDAVDENTYHLVCYCDVVNAYGQVANNRKCDAYVTVRENGTISVYNLNVY